MRCKVAREREDEHDSMVPDTENSGTLEVNESVEAVGELDGVMAI